MLVPLPTIFPGLIVQFPAGKLINSTLPVGIAQVGSIILLMFTETAAGSTIVKVPVAAVQLLASVTL